MIINENSQLGLMLWGKEMMLEYLNDSQKFLKAEVTTINNKITSLRDELGNDYDEDQLIQLNDGDHLFNKITKKLGYRSENKGSEFYTIKNPKPYLYLIQQSVHHCAEMIRIKENFSCTIFNKIKDGEHGYLLGRNEAYRFVKFNGVIKASYWDRIRHVAYEFGFDLEEDRYYFPNSERATFNRIVRLMTFVELGDIEITIIEKGRNNGLTKKNGKITNTSNNTVYVVDSSWNKLIIRTTGFAVRGHFRLQPCGESFKDRKLIWVDAFEKHGYKRKPRAEIVR